MAGSLDNGVEILPYFFGPTEADTDIYNDDTTGWQFIRFTISIIFTIFMPDAMSPNPPKLLRLVTGKTRKWLQYVTSFNADLQLLLMNT